MAEADNARLHMLIGELSATVRATSDGVNRLTAAVEGLARDAQQSAGAFSSLEAGLRHTNEDIRVLRESMITPDHMRKVGIHLEEADATKRDLEHLRTLRESADGRRPIGRSIVTAVLTLCATSAVVWIGPRLYEAVKIASPPATRATVSDNRA